MLRRKSTVEKLQENSKLKGLFIVLFIALVTFGLIKLMRNTES